MGAREDILKAATETFVEKGYAAARTQEIADKAGVNKAMLHYYFKTKEHLYDETVRAVFVGSFGPVLSRLAREDLTYVERVEAFIDGYIDSIARHPHLVGFVLHDLAAGGEKMISFLRETQITHDFLHAAPAVKMLQEGIENGQIKAIDPQQTIMSLLGMCVFFFFAEPVVRAGLGIEEVGKAELLEKRKRNIKQIFLTGVLSDPSLYQPESGRSDS